MRSRTRRRPKQQALDLGRFSLDRKKPGRRAAPHARVRHRPRKDFPSNHPGHVTLNVVPGLPSLRDGDVRREVEGAFRKGCQRNDVRLVHYSIQDDHAHLIVEASGVKALGRAMKSLASLFAFAVNRGLGRKGRVVRDRYHVHVLRTVREVRNAFSYVLNNARRHLAKLGRALPSVAQIDPASSGAWFEGWRPGVVGPEAIGPPPVAPPRTWLARFV